MKLSRILFILSILSITFIGCSGATTPPIESDCPAGTVVGNPSSSACYAVLADENLQDDHKEAILAALSEWAAKTNHTLSYSLSFIDMSNQTQAPDLSHTIKIFVHDPGPGYLGWTDWNADTFSAYMYIEPSVDAELFRRIMLHELGHAFNLNFNGDIHYEGPYASVMHPDIGDDALHVCCPEITAFCSEFGCQVDCTNVPQGTVTTDSLNRKIR